MSKILSNTLRYALIVPLLVIVINSIRFLRMSDNTLINDGYGLYQLIALAVAALLGVVIIASKSQSGKKKLVYILGIAFVLRLLWVIFVPSVPVSDYATMHHSAKEIVTGDFSGMKGISYFARYPHLNLSVMYMSLMRLLFGAYDLIAMKIVSLLLSVYCVFLIYKISKYFVKNQSIQLASALFASVFPPFVTYVSTFCTENIAMPFLLLSVLYFCKILNGEKGIKNIILCGVMLGVSNLFRGVGAIFVIAMFIAMCLGHAKHKFKIVCFVAVLIILVTVAASVPLKVANITENHLWEGKESSITYFLKGLNIESKGAWSKEDGEFVEKHFLDEDFNAQCIEIIKSRLQNRTPRELFDFFFHKFTNQWSYADCNGSYWAFMNTDIKYRYPIDFPSQLIGCILFILSLVSLIKKQKKNPALLHLLLCGFGLFFLVFETQPRYSYIVSWVFILLAIQGLEVLRNLFYKGTDK
ncbi:MAG: glycosyltransferase family 39 protein [Clostridia bacterium]|nr:glycosyltransferase family 39 protein [Clostridia bacterium]